MKAIRKPSAKPGFELIEAEVPTIGEEEVLVKVLKTSICGTDLHITQWDDWSAGRMKPPVIYGHEFCGEVAQVGSAVTQVKPGDYVSAEMHRIRRVDCGPATNQPSGVTCQNIDTGEIFGVDLDGCFAEYVKLPQWQLVKLPANLPPEYGACLDSLGNGIHAVTKGEVAGKTVLVVGCGPIGLFGICGAKAMGATQVYASDVNPYRLELAQKAGADVVWDARSTTVSEEILKLTDGAGVDVVLEMSGNGRAIDDAFKALRYGGTFVMMGISGKPVELDINRHIIFKEARVVGCVGRQIFKTWEIMIELLESGKLDIGFIITHQFPLSEFGTAIELVASGNTGKVVLTP